MNTRKPIGRAHAPKRPPLPDNPPDTVPIANPLKKRPARKHPGGRPTKRSAALVATLTDAMAAGLTDQQAADLAGISRSTLGEWLKAGDEFSVTIKKARVERLLLRLNLIESRVPNWQALAWILERTHGSQFAPPRVTTRLEHAQAGGLSEADLAEAESLLRLM